MEKKHEIYSSTEGIPFSWLCAVSNFLKVRNWIFVVGCILAALFVSLYSSQHSSDADEYRGIYDSIVFDEVPIGSFSRSEILYYYWNKFVGITGISFESFLFVSTLIFLPLKLMALRVLSGGADLILIFAIYIAIFFFLHDSIQYKISWALTFSVWSCIFIYRSQFFSASLLIILAVGFHVTAVLLPLIFFLSICIFDSRWFRYALFIVMMTILAFPFFFLAMLTSALTLYDDRLLNYFNHGFLEIQNTSGLFYYYIIVMTMFVMYISLTAFEISSKLLWVQILVTAISVFTLILLSNYVAIASRLSDVLGILLVSVLSSLSGKSFRGSYLRNSVILFFCIGFLLFRLVYLWGI